MLKKKTVTKKRISKISFFIILLFLSISVFLFYTLIKSNNYEPAVVDTAIPIKPYVLPAHGALLGVSLSYADPQELELLEGKIDKHFAIVGMYQSWGDENAMFNHQWTQRIASHNSIPLITWEPWKPVSGYDRSEEKVSQEEYFLKHITEGNFDAYISKYAVGVARYRKPVIIRFAHEMNGNWYPWGSKFNTPEEYIASWRHIHDIFESKGAANVIWLWSPNALYTDSQVPYSDDLEAFYPGDQYVDWVGFSAFNWAGIYKQNVWKDPEKVFTPTVTVLKTLNKPVIIAETASADMTNPAKKAVWIKELGNYIKADTSIRGVIWFNTDDNGINWRIESTKASVEAFKVAFDDYFIEAL